jgi:hypothetical protein
VGQHEYPKSPGPWTTTPGDTYRLPKTGDAKAWNVTLSSEGTLHLLDLPLAPDLDGGEAVTFMAAVSNGYSRSHDHRDLGKRWPWNCRRHLAIPASSAAATLSAVCAHQLAKCEPGRGSFIGRPEPTVSDQVVDVIASGGCTEFG